MQQVNWMLPQVVEVQPSMRITQMRVQVARYACFDLEQTSVSYVLAQDGHHPMIPEKLESKDEKTADLHTIFSG